MKIIFVEDYRNFQKETKKRAVCYTYTKVQFLLLRQTANYQLNPISLYYVDLLKLVHLLPLVRHVDRMATTKGKSKPLPRK